MIERTPPGPSPAERTRALTTGRDALQDRPRDLGLSAESVAYRTHAPVVGQSRDSDALERSNFSVVSEDLLEEYGETVSVHEEPCGFVPSCACPPDVVVERFRHWLVGWTETVLVRVERPGLPHELPAESTDAWIAALGWRDALERYPVADEEHWSALELAELTDYVSGELDGPDGPWTGAALEALDSWTLEGLDLEPILHALWTVRASSLVDRVRAWSRLRLVGTGQLTMDGDVVTVPAPPAVEELEELHPDYAGNLPWSVARVAAGTAELEELGRALVELHALRELTSLSSVA